MPKLIDYPRTNYTGAWELAEVVDDTGGKCAIDTAARKLNRKVSGSFKAIIGSAVKFGLMTSKRELLSTTTLFKRIKHAYDKQEELQFHREAFLTPPLFTQICRKFRGRELPIQMLDVMLIREFGVEEINAQGVAKAFVEGCRMCLLLDDHNIMADIDALNAQRPPRREIASPIPTANNFNQAATSIPTGYQSQNNLYDLLATPTPANKQTDEPSNSTGNTQQPENYNSKRPEDDAIANLFGFGRAQTQEPTETNESTVLPERSHTTPATFSNGDLQHDEPIVTAMKKAPTPPAQDTGLTGYRLSITGPGVSTSLDVTHEDDIAIAIALLEKIRRQIRATQ
ncbi:hypothetical protein [Hymenobacter negativus]|uniref:Uncharacterized protein n=1 Tax=Hymenobacter negativus TaxID=2795026 RepID=A0ABS3QMR3_9BACT|nr:hypothetical protein [Hymenobacter negativus]MBO2012537.1 hypothetical protein [Hymenobacter negativus]